MDPLHDSQPDIELTEVVEVKSEFRRPIEVVELLADEPAHAGVLNRGVRDPLVFNVLAQMQQQTREYEAKRKLSMNEKIRLIQHFELEPQLTQKELADRFKISQPQVSRTLKRRELLISEWKAEEQNKRIRQPLSGTNAGCSSWSDTSHPSWARRTSEVFEGGSHSNALRHDGPWNSVATVEQPTISQAGKEGSDSGLDDPSAVNLAYESSDHARQGPGPTSRESDWNERKEVYNWNLILSRLSGYDISDMYVVVDFGLHFRALPSSGIVGPDVRKVSDWDRVSVLACVSLCSERRNLLVVGRSKRPASFQNVLALPVSYTGSSQARITSDDFEMWLWDWNEELLRAGRKVVLMVTSAYTDVPMPLVGINFRQIELVPVSVGDELRVVGPFREAIIVGFKAAYRKLLLIRYVSTRWGDGVDVTRPGLSSDATCANVCAAGSFRELSLLQACHLMAQAWHSTNLSAIRYFFSEIIPLLPSTKGDRGDISHEEARDRFRMSCCDMSPPPIRMTAKAWRAYLDVDRDVIARQLNTGNADGQNLPEIEGLETDPDDDGLEVEPGPANSTDVVRALSTVSRYMDSRGLRSVIPSFYDLESRLLQSMCDKAIENGLLLTDLFPK